MAVDELDDEMELTEFYTGAGSQSVDCEASPPALQVSKGAINLSDQYLFISTHL